MKNLIGTDDIQLDGSGLRWQGRFPADETQVFRLSAGPGKTLRLQMAGPDGSIDSDGASQQLADEFGQLVEEAAALRTEEASDVVRVFVEGVKHPTAEIDRATGEVRFLNKLGEITLAIVGIAHDGAGLSVSGALTKDEALYGTGERFNGVNQRGKIIRIWAIDQWCETEGNSYVPVPFLLSSRGYGVYLNRFESSLLDLGVTDPTRWTISAENSCLDLYIFLQADPKDRLRAYADLTGHSPIPAEWTFGVHVSRHGRLREFADPVQIRTMMREMEGRDLPYSSVIIEGWGTYDRSTYAELKAIVTELHSAGKKVLVYDAGGRVSLPANWGKEADIAISESLQGVKEEYLIHNGDGDTYIEESAAHNPADAPHRRNSHYLDITNPAAVDWWLDSVWKPLIQDIGIDGAKIDFCEQIPEHGGITYHDGRSPEGMHHRYPVAYNTIMYRYFQKHRPDGGMCFSRGGGIGTQRYPFLWCGDQRREWSFLHAILSATLSLGVSGVPFVSHDLGGYMPAESPDENDEARVFVRGTQLACFTLNMQTHGIVTRPYDFDPETVALYRTYSRIHYALIPYLSEYSRLACETGVPVLRHLFIDYPDDSNVYGIEDQYLLGDDLLVAPILDDEGTRRIYFPVGTWTCLYTGEEITGETHVDEWSAPLSRIPVFVNTERHSTTLEKVLSDIIAILREDGIIPRQPDVS